MIFQLVGMTLFKLTKPSLENLWQDGPSLLLLKRRVLRLYPGQKLTSGMWGEMLHNSSEVSLIYPQSLRQK
jgi:hypothetical protein